MEKSELLVPIAKVSRKKIETRDQKVHNFQLNDNYRFYQHTRPTKI